jgi:hypothetical protein
MRPLAALLAILTGSAVALAVGLLLTWVVILFLPADEARFAPEHAALLKAIGVFGLFSAVSAASLYGELRLRAWRFAAHAATAAMFAIAVWAYWPR